ncbi:MAG: MFS transporter [Alphaproteobacteria bacterium]|nr:MFS transporter [Alphaproteobacteria bacterium]
MRGQVFILPVLYLFYQKNGLSLSDFFYFQGIAIFVSLLFYVPAGYLGDIFSKKKVLILSMLFALTRAVLWISFSGYWIVLAGEIAYALSRPFFSGIVDSYMYDYLQTHDHQQKMVQNYGRLNFYMSLSSAVSALIGPFFLKDFSINFLIALEIIFIFFNMIFLTLLPETPVFNNRGALIMRYQRVFSVFRFVASRRNLFVPMLYSGLFSATTILLVWCFQPLMVFSLIPVVLFGVISFINHSCRALLSCLSHRIKQYVSLRQMQFLASGCFLLSLSGMVISFMIQSMYLAIACLVVACFATGLQLIYTIFAISYVHSQIHSQNRALVSSLNFMIATILSSSLLIIFKECVQIMPIEYALTGYMALFCIAVLLGIKKVSD